MECFRFFFAKSILSYFYDLLGIYITCMWSEFLTVKKYKSFIYTRKCIFRLIFYPCFQQIIHNISLYAMICGCLGHKPHWFLELGFLGVSAAAVLKVGALNMRSETLTPQGEAESWGSPHCMVLC